ncbi:MAG: Ig-like domain-containing protein [Thermoleophilia bacterium]|nr:Ig-like domain-containing protein [Thermoleophilia bacterium]
MRMRRFDRKTPIVILLLCLTLGLVLTGVYQQGKNEASAVTFFDPMTTSWTFVPGLLASNHSPVDGATEVALTKNVTVRFNLDVNPLTLDSSTFYIQNVHSSTKLPAMIYYSLSRLATLSPYDDLLPNSTYVVTLTNGIQTTGGTPLFNPGSWSFSTISSPQVVSRIPTVNAVDVPVDRSISVVFDKTMDWSTVTAGSFYLQEMGGGTVSTSIQKSVDKKTARLTQATNLKEGTTYVVTLTTAVKAENGLSLPATVIWSFTTAADAPQVTTKVPADGATGAPVDQVVSATFDKAMDASTLTSATFYLKKMGGTPLPATVTYNAVTWTASLDPLAALEEGATYEARLTTAVESASGAPLASAVVWSFSTAGEAPSVIDKVPAPGATGMPVDQIVMADFDREMDPATLTSATFYIKKSGGAPLPASVTYSSTNRSAKLAPAADLEAGATYEVTLTAAVEGADGQTLAGAPVTWSFTTAASGGGGSAFSDVIPGETPYAAAIIALANEGVILGFEDGTFRPNTMVTRQQFAKMIVLTLGLIVTGAEVCPFTDVVAQVGDDPFYPSKYVAVCAANGITQGKTPTTFDPHAFITHQQLITMVARAVALSDPPPAYAPTFTAGQFSLNEHYLNARKAAYAGLLNGLLGIGPSYDFLAGSTRGECAQILYSVMLLMEM